MQKKKRILILGSSGMAGHVINFVLQDSALFEIRSVNRSVILDQETRLFDLRNTSELIGLIDDFQPDIVINAAGILNQNQEKNVAQLVYINGYFPHLLVELSETYGFKIIHLTTDCVFSGYSGGYKETDFKDGDDWYGRSKGLGEIVSDKHLSIRTSFIGPELKENGTGLFHWFLTSGSYVEGFTNVYWSGVTTLQLALFIKESIFTEIGGLVHLVNDSKISKYDLLCLIRNIWKVEIEIGKSGEKFIDKSLIASKEIKGSVPPYEVMLQSLRRFMIENNNQFRYTDIYNDI